MPTRRTWKSSPYSYLGAITGRAKVPPKKIDVLTGRKVYGECICVVAPAREGKTLTTVKILVERLETEPNIEEVVSNVPLNLRSIGMQDKFEYFSDVDQLRKVPPKEMVRIVFIDEMRRLVDSRMSVGQKNRLISNIFADEPKSRTDLYYTDQDAWAVDKRVRVNVNYVIYPMFDYETQFCKNYFFKSLRDYDNFIHYGIGAPFYVYAFWAPAFYHFFDTEFKIKDFHMRFHPEGFVEDFLKWYKGNEYEGKKISANIIRYWDKTQAIGLDASEKDALLTHLKLNGLV